MNSVDVLYNGEQVSVPKEVAEFLEQDRKRALAQNKQDERHLSNGCIKAAENVPPKAEGLCHLTGPLSFLFFWFTTLLQVS